MGNQQTNQKEIWEYFIPESCVYRKKCKSGYDFGDKSNCLHRKLQEPNMNVKEMFVMSNRYVMNDRQRVKKKIRVLRRRISRLEQKL
tara:strand:- start:622 stop:882 length:261 start_codon:yes stop_codon:yes gene_type:complete